MAKLVRQRDNKEIEGFIEFIEFNELGRGKKVHMKPDIGFACIVDRQKLAYTWQTTSIIEVISDTEFKTQNSHYKIEK